MQIPIKNKIPKIISGIVATIVLISLGDFILSPFWFWVSLEIIAAALVAIGCSGEWWLHHLPAGRKKKEKDEHHKLESRFMKAMVALGVIIELFALGHSIKEGKELENKVSEASGRAATNELQVAVLSNETVHLSINLEEAKSNNLELSKQVLELEADIAPRRITKLQRETFIRILNDSDNVCKTHIKVFVGATDQETENFANDFREMLNEAGYGTSNDVVEMYPDFRVMPPKGTSPKPVPIFAVFSSPNDGVPIPTVGFEYTALVFYPSQIAGTTNALIAKVFRRKRRSN